MIRASEALQPRFVHCAIGGGGTDRDLGTKRDSIKIKIELSAEIYDPFSADI